MSVFQSIKGTLHNVQQDLVESFKALTSIEAPQGNDVLRRLHNDGVSLDAGADILYKYQKSWGEMQEFTTRSAKKAQEVDRDIAQVYKLWNREADVISRLEEEVEELPALVTLIKQMTIDIEYIQADFHKVEGAIDRLENVCEDVEQQKNKVSHRSQLALYKNAKMEEGQKLKVLMAKSHAHTIQEFDRRRMENMKDRQEAFTDAFSQDMDYYKAHGHSELNAEIKVADIPIPKVSSLSDVRIDNDEEVINEFLESETNESLSKERKDSDMSEEAFFEDDYTTDYNIQPDTDLMDDDIVGLEHEGLTDLNDDNLHNKDDNYAEEEHEESGGNEDDVACLKEEGNVTETADTEKSNDLETDNNVKES